MATRMKRVAATLLLAWAAACAPALAQPAPVQFLNTAADGSLTYTVPAAVDLQILFAARPGKYELQLTPFVGEQGDTVSLRPSIPEIAGAGDGGQRLSFQTSRGLLTLRLQGSPLPGAAKYTGTLAVLEDGKHVQTSRIVLSRVAPARSAKLVIEPKSIVVHQSNGEAAFNLQIRNADANWPADGVFLRLLEATAPAGTNLDPARNLELTWNGARAADLWRSPSPGARAIAPNQQAELGGRIVDLPAGEYTLKLGVGSANLAADAEQQVTIKAYVKHAWWWALLALAAAIALSYFATKGLEAQRRRGAQLQKVADIRPYWLRDEPAPLPIVAARALLGQVEQRNASLGQALFGQDVNASHLERAKLLLRVMQRVRDLQARVPSAGWNLMVINRFGKLLSAIIGKLDPQTITEEKAKEMEAALGGLELWFDRAKLDELYWNALKGEMLGLKARVKPDAFDAKQQPLVKALYGAVDTALTTPPAGNALSAVEEKYAQLKVLVERHEEGDAKSLAVIHEALAAQPGMSIRDFFRLVDSLAWKALQGAKLELTVPPASGKKAVEPLRAFELIRFVIEPEQPTLGRNYLFKHAIEYDWLLEIEKRGVRKELARRKTMEPRLVQFVPEAGTLHLTVKLRFDGNPPVSVPLAERTIERSADYGWLSAFRFNEMAALAIASLAALSTGMALYYFGKPAFGGIADYMALFTWGAGFDQTKSFLQNLEKTAGR